MLSRQSLLSCPRRHKMCLELQVTEVDCTLQDNGLLGL